MNKVANFKGVIDPNDIIGTQYGKLTAIEYIGKREERSGTKRHYYKCKCSCGNELEVARIRLISGNTKSCGCYAKQITSEIMSKDYTGQKFGRLSVVERIAGQYYTNKGIPQVKYRCVCECGKEVLVNTGSLQSGNSMSCGCLNIEKIIERNHDPALIMKRQLKASDNYIVIHWKTQQVLQCRGFWEKSVIGWLNNNKIDFDWQIPFKLPDGRTYIIDFFDKLRNTYVEIKGWWRDDAKEKFDLFKNTNPDLIIEIWGKAELLSKNIPIRDGR